MEQDESDEFSEFLITRRSENVKSYSNTSKKVIKKEPEPEETSNKNIEVKVVEPLKGALTTKKAVELLLEGALKSKVCRYCLNISAPLYELDQVFQIGGQGSLYKVTVRDMIASFYPYKEVEDPNFPNRLCVKCLDSTISAYLFTQQCERSGRALRNCFEDIYEKLDKLDPVNPLTKKRGRQKLNPNHNILYSEHEKVINYADPIIHLINSGIELTEKDKNEINELECPKCAQILPDIESLINHEKKHPKNMWFNCRLCGKSYPKRHLYRKHMKTEHDKLSEQLIVKNTDFQCTNCGVISEVYDKHLQHIEKHKFQMIMEHLVERRMDKLCVVCMGKGIKMVDLNKMISLHGGCPELTGQRSLYNILGSTMPEMNILHTYTGTKLCEKCLDHAITSYVFLNQAHYIRNRLNTCVSLMLDNLDKIDNPCGKIFIEISQDVILPDKEPDIDESLFIEENEEFDESKLKIEVLEDEFRIISESDESEMESTPLKIKKTKYKNYFRTSEKDDFIKNPKNIIKTYNKRKYNNRKLNGIQPRYERNDMLKNNICSEFLTFKKKRKTVRKFYRCKYTCPLCSKHFISDYFLRRHILKHIPRKVECTKCQMHFKSKFNLYEHMRIVHLLGNNSYYSCVNCSRTFVSHNKLLAHSKTHRNVQCHLCDKIFESQAHYNNHMQRHRVKLMNFKERHVQTCSFCEKACSNDNDLSVHVNKVHLQIKPYSCDMCEKQFYTETNMNWHKKVHSKFSKESCKFCNKTLKSRMELVIHVRKHIDVKPYCCQICLQTFYSQTKLKSHLRIFHGGQFCCKLCKAVFVSKSGLKGHINRVHNII